MVNDAHRQLHGASESSLEQVFKRLEELKARQEACEARLEADESWQRRHEQEAKDAMRLLMLARDAQEADRPVTADGASGDWAPAPPGCRPSWFKGVITGSALALATAFVPAAAHTVTHHQAYHVTAAHVRRARADPDGHDA